MNTFTEAHAAQVLEFLGYAVTSAADRQYVVARLEEVEAVGTDYVNRVIALLNQLTTIQQDIFSATPFASRSFQSSPSSTAQHFRGDRIRIPTVQARQLVNRLSTMLTIPVRGDAFGGSGLSEVVR